MDTARLRKTFRYSKEDVSDDRSEPTALDEEEQEKLIARFKKEDEERNVMYKRIFLAIPLMCTAAFLPSLLTSRLLHVKFIDLFAIASLGCTAYTLISIGNEPAEIPYEGASQPAKAPGPVQRYIDHLNGGLSSLICLNALTLREREGVHEGFWLLCVLPLVAFVMVISARKVMLEVDFAELEHLRYEYKGA